MLIDWFTVGAQALNFVILVALLKRFLYRPVLDAIDAREARIARQLADADATESMARRERDDYERRNKEFDAQRQALLQRATDEAEAEGSRLAHAARQAADQAASRRQDADRRDTARARRQLAEHARAEVIAITARVVGDLADASLDERISAVFLRRFAALDDAEFELLASGLEAAHPRVTIRTAGTLDDTGRDSLRAAVVDALQRRRASALDTPVDVAFEATPDLIGGIELVIAGRKIGWNVAQYLASLERVFDTPAAPGPVAETAA